MLDVADRGIALVIGSRYVPGGTVTGWPRRRTWLSRWGNRYVAIMLGLAINDATAGYRVYRTDALRAIGLDGVQASGYVFQVEMTYRVVRSGLSVVEIPIAFTDRVVGSSKMNRAIIFESFRLVTLWGLQDMMSLKRAPTGVPHERLSAAASIATIRNPMRRPSTISPPVGRFADVLLASDLPGPARRPPCERTTEFIEQRVSTLPSFTRFGVVVISFTRRR